MYETLTDSAVLIKDIAVVAGVVGNVISVSVGLTDPYASRTVRQLYERVPGFSKPLLRTSGVAIYPGYILGRKIYQKFIS